MRTLSLLLIMALSLTGCFGSEGMTPLMKAANNGDLASVKRLVTSGTPVDQNSKYKWTPLMFAIKEGNKETVEYLLGKGADPNHRSDRIVSAFSTTVPVPASTPVQEAVYYSQLEILKMLIAAGGSVNRLETIEWAVRNGNIPMLKVILEQPIDQRIMDGLLIYASGPALRLLVKHGSKINKCSDDTFATVLGLAMEQRTLDDAGWLIAHGADVDMITICGETPLIHCAEKRLGPERIEFLLKNKANINAYGGTSEGTRGTALTWAMRRLYDKKDLEAVRVLLRHRPDLSMRDAYGETAIEILRETIRKEPVLLADDVKIDDLVRLLKEMER